MYRLDGSGDTRVYMYGMMEVYINDYSSAMSQCIPRKKLNI